MLGSKCRMANRVLPLERLQLLSERIRASSDAAELERLLTQVLDFCDVINFDYSYDSVLLRGVRCDSDRGFANINRVGHPPPHLARSGRLNEAGYPVLYASISQFAVLEEIGVNAGDFVQFVGYAFKPDACLRACIVGEITQVSRWGRSLLSEEVGHELNRIMLGMTFDVGRSFVFTDALLTWILRDPLAAIADYVRSRILARLLLGKAKGLDSIVYPSVAHEGAMNFAIQPQAAQAKLSIGATFVLHVKKKFDYGIYDFEVVRQAKGHHGDGTIDWQ
jgi:RES domain